MINFTPKEDFPPRNGDMVGHKEDEVGQCNL